MARTREEFDDRLFVNPKIKSTDKDSFETNMLEQAQANKSLKLNVSMMVRAFVCKFNEDPEAMIKHLGLK